MSNDNDMSKLMTDAMQQLEEHKVWLKDQLHEYMHALPGGEWKIAFRVVIDQVDEIKLRMTRVDAVDNVSLLWEYPDELLTFLRSTKAPQHLRASLEGGRLVEPEQPGHSVKRAPNTAGKPSR